MNYQELKYWMEKLSEYKVELLKINAQILLAERMVKKLQTTRYAESLPIKTKEENSGINNQAKAAD